MLLNKETKPNQTPLFIFLHLPFLLEGRLDCIQCLHKACWPTLICPYVGVTGEHCLSVSPCFSSSAQHVLFVLFGWFERRDASGSKVAVLWGAASNISLKQLTAFFSSSSLELSQNVSWESGRSNHALINIYTYYQSKVWRQSESMEEALQWCVCVRGACAHREVRDLQQVKGKFNQTGYHSKLQHHAIPSGTQLVGQGLVLMLDNDPKHTSKLSQRYIKIKEEHRI